MEKLAFIALLSALLIFACGALWMKGTVTHATVLVAILFIAAAFYLFQFGSLSSFSVEALSAKASFIREKAVEAESSAARIEEIKKEAQDQIESLRSQIAEADRETKKLAAMTEFHTAVILAQNDSRAAFDQLYRWSNDKSSPFAQLALQAYQVVMDEHSKSFFEGIDKTIWRQQIEKGDNIDLSHVSLVDLYKGLSGIFRASLLSEINEDAKLTKNQKIRIFAEVLNWEPSLRNVEFAGRFLASQTDQKIKALALHYFLNWWKENSAKYSS